MSISRSTRIGLPAAALLLASGLLFACGSTGESGTYFSAHPDAGVVPEGVAPPPSGNVLSIECGPFGPSRISRSAIAQFDPQVVVADFNCDGHPDTVTGSSRYGVTAYGALRLRLGNGDGTFVDGGAIDLGMDAAPVGMVTGDFNTDGAPDLVVAASRGNGQGAIVYYKGSCGQQPWSPQVVADPTAYLGTDMAAKDMNGDGYEDLVLPRAAWPNRIDVLLGGGVPFEHMMSSDTFSDATPEGAIRALAVGDFDGDGRPDAAVVTGKSLQVLAGTGTGKLMNIAQLSGTGWFAVKAAALGGTGRDEIVTMKRIGLSPTVVDAYELNGQEGLLVGRTLLEMPGATQLQAADLDGDGIADLAVSGPKGTNWPSKLLLSGGEPIDLPSTRGTLRLADVTGDGRTDLVFDASYGLEVYPHLPLCAPPKTACSDGVPYSRVRYALSETPWQLLFGDVTGDGIQDVILVGNNTVGILYNDRSGEFSLGPSVQIKATGVALANVEGTAKQIITVDGSPGWTLVRANGTRNAVAPAGFPDVSNVVAGDFNGDLHDDLAFKSSAGLEILPGADAAARFHINVKAFLLRAVDFNHDGRTDLLLAPYGGGGLCVMYGPLNQRSSCHAVPYAPRYPVDLGDLDGDGRPDMPFAGTGATINLWSQQGAFGQVLMPEYGWRGAHILSRAGGPAALLVVAKGGALAVYAGNGDGTLGPGGPVSVQQSAGPLALVVTHDLDADGNDEIFEATSGAEPNLWVMHRCGTSSAIY